MRAAIVHGVLLLVMLVYGYRTWTRDKEVKKTTGSVVLWNKADADFESIEYVSERKTTRLDRKAEGYWWGSETTTEKKPIPPKTDEGDEGSADEGAGSSGSGSAVAAGSGSAGSGSAGSGSAGSGSAGSGSAAVAKKEEPKFEDVKVTAEFPLGKSGNELVAAYRAGRALADLGVLTPELKEKYKLADSKNTLTITFKGGEKRVFAVGSTIYGGSDRYVMDPATSQGWVIAKDYVQPLDSGKPNLQLGDPRGFEEPKLEAATIEGLGISQGKTRKAALIETTDAGQTQKTWGDAVTKKPDAVISSFLDTVKNLRPMEYNTTLKIADLTPLMRVTYNDGANAKLGTLTFYKRSRQGERPKNADPTLPVDSITEYFIVTEATRVAGMVRPDVGQRAEENLPVVFGDKPPPATPTPTGPDPHDGHGPDDGMHNPGGPGMSPPGGPGMSPTPGGMSPRGGTPPAEHGGMTPVTPAGGSMTPAGGSATKPAAGGSATPSGGSATKPAAGGSTAPAGGSATKPAAAGSGAATKPAATGSATPPPPAPADSHGDGAHAH
jgi:hypothetical protein